MFGAPRKEDLFTTPHLAILPPCDDSDFLRCPPAKIRCCRSKYMLESSRRSGGVAFLLSSSSSLVFLFDDDDDEGGTDIKGTSEAESHEEECLLLL